MISVRKRLFTDVSRWLLRGPLPAALRRWRPIARIRKVWVISRHADACEVLDRDGDFAVPYRPKMDKHFGPFVMGIDDESRHRRAREALDRADHRHEPDRHREELQRVERHAGTVADALLDGADGAIDVVHELSDRVAHAGIAQYVGIEAPDAATLLRWCRAIGSDIFLNPLDNAGMARKAEEAATELRRLVDARIDEREPLVRERSDDAETLLDRLLVSDDLDEEAVRGAVMGLVVLWAIAVPRATALAFDELLRRPELSDAQSAARSGDDQLLVRYLFEALRFEPLAPAVARVCQGATLSGDPRKRVVKPDSTVVAVLGSAMMDPGVVADPKRFHGTRDPGEYGLHFGRGAHACWGEGIAMAQMTAISRALLRREGLRRSAGSSGKLVLEGAFPTQLGVAFEPTRR